jgi:hypothetical protein
MGICNYYSIIFAKNPPKYWWVLNSIQKQNGSQYGCHSIKLLFFNFQDAHRTSLGANTAGNALGHGILLLMYHHLGRTYFHTLTATDTQLLVDHIDAGLGILADRAMGAGAHAFAALYAGLDLGFALVVHDLYAALGRIKLLVEGLGAGPDAAQARHALNVFIGYKLLHRLFPPTSCV